MVSLLNGFSQAAKAGANFAHDYGLAQQKSDLEKEQVALASQLQEGVQTRVAHVQGVESRDTATVTAKAQGDASIATNAAANALPMTAAQTAAASNASGTLAETRRHNEFEEKRPIPGGYTGTYMVPDKNDPTGWKMVNTTSNDKPIEIDKESNNLTAQIGLPQNVIDMATGQTKGQRLTAQQTAANNRALTDWAVKNNIDISMFKPKVEALYKNVERNLIQYNSIAKIEGEIDGSVETASKVSDDIKSGRVSMANIAARWAGKEVNDPKAIQAADQLGRLVEELAAFNAAAGGHFMENGQLAPTPENRADAQKVVLGGINSGGLKGLQESLHASAAKNRVVIGKATDDASEAYFKLWGATYHRPLTTDGSDNSGGGGGGDNKPKPDPKVQEQINGDSIKSTATKRGITEEQVKSELRNLGYQVP